MSAIASHAEVATALLQPRREVPAGIIAAQGQESAHRFAVHRNNVVVSLVDALVDSFPVCHALVGDAFFRAMARERVLADPPRSPVLFEYAEGFAEFVTGFAPADSVPYLAEVARIEAARLRAWHAADAVPVAGEEYHALAAAPERLAATRVRLHPACQWLRCRHAAHAIWSAHQGLSDPGDATLAGIEIGEAQDVLVARPQLQLVTTVIVAGTIEFLDTLARGDAMATAFEAAQGANPDIDAAALFAILIRHGLVVALASTTEQ